MYVNFGISNIVRDLLLSDFIFISYFLFRTSLIFLIIYVVDVSAHPSGRSSRKQLTCEAAGCGTAASRN